MAGSWADEWPAGKCRSPASRIAQNLRDLLTGRERSEAPLGTLSGALRARSGHFGTKSLPASSLLTAEGSAGRISASRCGLRVGSSAHTPTPDENGISKIQTFSVSKGQKPSGAVSVGIKEPSGRRNCLLREYPSAGAAVFLHAARLRRAVERLSSARHQSCRTRSRLRPISRRRYSRACGVRGRRPAATDDQSSVRCAWGRRSAQQDARKACVRVMDGAVRRRIGRSVASCYRVRQPARSRGFQSDRADQVCAPTRPSARG